MADGSNNTPRDPAIDGVTAAVVDEVHTAACDVDLKSSDAAEMFGTTPQTINRWVREILSKHNLDLGYFVEGARWLRPADVEIIRKYREGDLGSSDKTEGESANEPQGEYVEQAGDQAHQGFSNITMAIDAQLNQALDARDAYIQSRGQLMGRAFNPNTITTGILQTAAQEIAGEGQEDLGELAMGVMTQPFQRRTGNLSLNGSSPTQRKLPTRTEPKSSKS